MRWIDSNIFLRFREGKTGPVEFIRGLKTDGVKYYLPLIVVAEIEWVLRSVYKVDKKNVVDFLDSIVGIDNIVVISEGNINFSLSVFRKYNIKLVDAMIVSMMKDGDEIVSYDRDFDKISEIRRVEP